MADRSEPGRVANRDPRIKAEFRNNNMMRTNVRLGIGRLGFYVGAAVLAGVVWIIEVYIQSKPQVYGAAISSLDPLQEKQLGAFLQMNQLLIALGTALLGAIGFFLDRRRKSYSTPRQLWAAFASALCGGLSLYFGYRAYEDVVLMLEPPYPTFDLTGSLILWDRYAHFGTFLLGVFFFADFAFHELTGENKHEYPLDVRSR